MKEVQQDHDHNWVLINRLEALEQCEQVWELQISIQEDQIQLLMREIDELQGKICQCHECPGVMEGPILVKGTNTTDEEEDEGLQQRPTSLIILRPLPWRRC